MFSSTNIPRYLLLVVTIAIASYVGRSFIQKIDTNNDHVMIQKYILNESPLYGNNRPKLWIHSKYEINARKWRDFQSRNTTDLNQPYLLLTIKSIIEHCQRDFNICLIDDDSFSHLLPHWDIDLKRTPEPFRDHYREVALLELLNEYGGMIVPNSFVCRKPLKPVYDECIAENKPFLFENRNKHHQNHPSKRLLFVPDIHFMGSPKRDPTLKNMIEYARKLNSSPHFSEDLSFLGDLSYWCLDQVQKGHMNLILGQRIGTKNTKKVPILLEDLMDEKELQLSCDNVGIYIPGDELLTRTKYQWYPVLSIPEVLQSTPIVSKYLRESLMSATDEYSSSKTTIIKSETIVAI
jgi:hypothetical protein